MTLQQQPEYLVTEMQLRIIETFPNDCIHILDAIRSRPYSSAQSGQERHWRDLFVSDLRSLIDWDARHGNPELFKAVETLNKYYNSFTVKQHNDKIRKDERIKTLIENNVYKFRCENCGVFTKILTLHCSNCGKEGYLCGSFKDEDLKKWLEDHV